MKQIKLFHTCSGFTPVKFPLEGNEENPHRTVYSKDGELHDEGRSTDEPRSSRIVVEIFGVIRHCAQEIGMERIQDLCELLCTDKINRVNFSSALLILISGYRLIINRFAVKLVIGGLPFHGLFNLTATGSTCP